MKIKNLIIFSIVFLLAFQALYFIHIYGVNLLSWDELDFVPFVKSFHDNGPFWSDSQFLQHYEHRHFLPLLIILLNVVLTSWNTIYQMYLGWTLIVLSLFIIFLLLKKTDPRLIWLMIPIAVFMFNTAQYENLLVGFFSNDYFLTTAEIILSIYFLNRVKHSKTSIIPAITFAVLASYSEILGLLIWFVGVISLIPLIKTRKIFLLTWITSATIVFIMYFTNYKFGVMKGLQFSTLLTHNSLEYVLSYLSNGFSFHSIGLQIVAGFVIVLLIVVGPIYLKLKRYDVSKLVPWIQFGLIGIFFALITELARLGIESPLSSRYVTLSNFSQTSALVIGTIIFIQSYDMLKISRKRIIPILIFLILIILLGTVMINSYDIGWKDGHYWYQYRSFGLQCMTNPMFDFKCGGLALEPASLYQNAKILQELKLGPFTNEQVSIQYSSDPLMNIDNWKNMTNDLEGTGYIDYIGSLLSPEKKVIDVDKKIDRIRIDGWGIITKKDQDVNSVYVFIDGVLNNRATYDLMRPDIPQSFGEGVTYFSGWSGIIDPSQLSEGCHNISVRIVKENHFFVILTDHKLCIN